MAKIAFLGTGNMGAPMTRCLLKGGHQVTVWNRTPDKARTLEKEISALGRKALGIRCDVTKEADVAACVRQTVSSLGRLDIVVSNAGIQGPQAITETSVEDWDRMMAVHLRGAFLVSREAAKHMIPRRTGWIIFTCSQLGYIGRERYTAYSAAKAGLIVFMRSLATRDTTSSKERVAAVTSPPLPE